MDGVEGLDLSLVKYIYLPMFLIIFAAASVIPALSYLTLIYSGDRALSTLVIGIFGLTYAISSIPSGFIHQILEREFLLIEIGIIVMMLSGLLFFTNDSILFLVSRGIIGIAEALVFVGFVGIIVKKYSIIGEATPILGKFFSIMGLGLLIAPSVGSIFMTYSAFTELFIMYLLTLLISFLLIIGRVRYKIVSRDFKSGGLGYKNLGLFSILPILMVLSVGSSDGTYQSRPVIWFSQLLLNTKYAGYLITTYYISAIASQLLLPEIAKRLGYRKGFLINLGISILTLLSIGFSISITNPLIKEILIYITGLLIGFDVGLLSPYGTEMITRLFGKNYLIGSGTANTIWAIGYFSIPTILAYQSTGYIADVTIVLFFHMLCFILALMSGSKLN